MITLACLEASPSASWPDPDMLLPKMLPCRSLEVLVAIELASCAIASTGMPPMLIILGFMAGLLMVSFDVDRLRA